MIFIFLFLLCSSASFGLDICAQYELEHLRERSQSLTVERSSFCNDTGRCEGLLITCHYAFTYLASRQLRLVDSPPILATISTDQLSRIAHSEREYSRQSRRSEERELQTFFPNLRGFQSHVEYMVDRILSSQYLVYSAVHDAPMVNRLISWATMLSRNTSVALLDAIHSSEWMRQWAWSIRMLMDSLIFTGISFRETQLRLVGMAPFVHAFLHATYILRIHYPLMISDETFLDFIHTIVRYHPQYTGDDGLWYIRIPPSWQDRPSRFHFTQLDNGDPEYVIDMASTYRGSGAAATETSFTDAQIVAHQLLLATRGGEFSERSLYDIHQLFRYVHQLSGADFPVPCSEYVALILSMIQRARHSPPRTLFTVFDIFNSGIPSATLLQSLPLLAVSNAMVRPPNHLHGNLITLRHDHLAHDALVQVGLLHKYHLAGRLVLKVMDSDTGQIVGYSGGAHAVFHDIIKSLFETGGIFEPADSHSPLQGRRILAVGAANPSRETLVAVGRLIALAVWGGGNVSCNLLAEYMGSSPSADSTILSTVFFNSNYIREGFYDVFFEGSVEYLFRNNATRVVEALL